ncbi:MAG: GNAT family N-acetyltransferase [Burkholderiales bacterium]|nr:GNAT family N-acetyltransferase [Burkholderiales bacterium]
MKYTVVSATEAHLPDLYSVIDAVAREGKYLAFTKAPAWKQSLAFYQSLLNANAPYFVALDGDAVIGWCDVSPLMGESRAHIGVLGMGLLPTAHGQGLGRQLMEAAIAKSWVNGLSRLQLTVRADNLNAKMLYERMGFEMEGLFRQGCVLGDEVHDVWSMALLRKPTGDGPMVTSWLN